uniref:ATPase family gene 2 protein homolog B-like n=1 Tax=Myxine glutinosa TaxID=7769 RepID=UPI00358EE128
MDSPESKAATAFNIGVGDARIPTFTFVSPPHSSQAIDQSLPTSSRSPPQQDDSIFQSSAVSAKDSSLPFNDDACSQYAASFSPGLTSACSNKYSHLTSTPLQPPETKSFSSDTPSFSSMPSSFHTRLQMTFPTCSSPLRSHSPAGHVSTVLPTLNRSVSSPPHSVLWRVHSDPRDDGTGRCRLGHGALEVLGVPRLGAPLRLTLERGRFAVCSAWPRWDRSDHHIQVDTSCVGPHGKDLKLNSKGQWSKVVLPQAGAVPLRNLQVVRGVRAEHLLLWALLSENEGIFKYGSRNNTTIVDLEREAREMLRGLWVAPGCIVRMPGSRILGFLILEARPANALALRLGAKTRLAFAGSGPLGTEPGLRGTGNPFEDLPAGLEGPATVLREALSPSLYSSLAARRLGLTRSCHGVLLIGPPGSGKTQLVRNTVHALSAILLPINGPEVFAARAGEAEAALREVFARAKALAAHRPCLIFIDELDALCPRRGCAGASEARVVAQLLTLLDGATGGMVGGIDAKRGVFAEAEQEVPLLVVAATNRPEAVDPALRRPGRFDTEVVLGVPSLAQRGAMLVHLTGCLPLDGDVTPPKLAELTPGYVPADLVALCRSAASRAMLRRASVEALGRGTYKWQQWNSSYSDGHYESDVRKSEGEGNRLKMERNEDHERVEALGEVDGRVDFETADAEFYEKNVKDSSVSVDNVVSIDVSDDKPLHLGGCGLAMDGGEAMLGQVVDATVNMGLGRCEALGESDGRGWDLVVSDVGGKVTMEDFYRALHIVGPSVLRCSYAPRAIPLLTWDDIGGLQGVKLKLQQCIEWPLRNPAALRRLGVTPPRGVLLYGPPGCAKTSLAQAAANSFTVSFLSAGAADIFSPGFGDPEKTLVELFRRARAAAPSLLFLDELDAVLCVRAGARGDGGAAARLLSTLLTEMDGVGYRLSDSKSHMSSPHSCAESGVGCTVAALGSDDCENDRRMEAEKWSNQDNSAVLVLAATNRPELIDEALLRPGRLDRRIYVPPPNAQERQEILRRRMSACPLAADVCLPTIADLTPFYSGADLTAVCTEACLLAMHHEGMDSAMLHQEYLLHALHLVPPSLSADQLCSYEQFFQGRP